ncbi:hypothetical protein T484DRAFT_1942889 [Baffinella frigidus]|nr:hypothetical protein T484DRAFT_1942889 [Cryptophyta sp. CCMP2293]
MKSSLISLVCRAWACAASLLPSGVSAVHVLPQNWLLAHVDWPEASSTDPAQGQVPLERRLY